MTARMPLSLFLIFGVTLSLCATTASQEKSLDYIRDIRPILADKCFICHGPDEESREADLRLDTRQGLFGLRDDIAAVVPRQPRQSQLLERVAAEDPDERMPPPDSKLTLSAEEIARLENWIEQGAPFQKHWAFTKPERPELPTVKNEQWVRNDIDRFVLARIERAGLQPSPEADRYTLVRRLYLDLIGLPPTVQQADKFVQDTQPGAYQRLVDKLLDSPHYGEHWGRRWLDLARYADTNGYEKDRPRSIWAYRDWVIEAINRDMPFDQFTLEQIAGDMLPAATLQQKIATGFHRNTMLNEEGGVDVEQFRFEALVDRVSTTGAVWLGLTLGCAQCHTHKFDPLTQREYYQMFAFFNNCDEPLLNLPDDAITQRRAALQSQIATLTVELADHWPAPKDAPQSDSQPLVSDQGVSEQGVSEQGVSGPLAVWQEALAKKAVRWRSLAPRSLLAKNRATLTALEDHSVLASGDRPNNDTYVIEYQPTLQTITALKLEVLPHASLPAGGPGRASFTSGGGEQGDFLLSEFGVAVIVPGENAKPQPLAISIASQSYALKKRSAELAIDGVFDTGWSIGGGVGQSHDAVFQLKEPLRLPPGARLQVTLAQQYIHEMTIGRFRVSATDDRRPRIVSSGAPDQIERAALTIEQDRTPAQREELKRHFLMTAPQLAEQHKKIAALRKQLPPYPTSLVMQERSAQHERTTRVHHRGEYLKPTDPVEADVPDFLPPLAEGAPHNRLALGWWLASAENPLVGRVVMNRQWQTFFGRGVVRTTEDFGVQGATPSHPDLLDYLATELVARGWSRKAMHRLIVSSATYRQSSRVAPEGQAVDPDNLLLWRAPRVRVDAETVRDIALTASGQLSVKVGGPSVFPPQPPGVTALSYSSLKWETSSGPDRYRRGLYTFAKRTSPYAMFGLFDGPSGETCVVRRDRSNTPLQALTMLNDSVFIAAERHLARAVLTDGPKSTERRVVEIFRRYLTRPPSQEERSLIQQFYQRQLERLESGQLDAGKILELPQVEQSKGTDSTKEIDIQEWAAWALVARTLFNFDETITKE